METESYVDYVVVRRSGCVVLFWKISAEKFEMTCFLCYNFQGYVVQKYNFRLPVCTLKSICGDGRDMTGTTNTPKQVIHLPVFCLTAAGSLCLSGLFLLYLKLPLFLTVPLAVGLLLLLLWSFRLSFSRRAVAFSAVFSALLAASFIIGGKINTRTGYFASFYGSDILYGAVLMIVFFLCSLRFMEFERHHPVRLATYCQFPPRKVWGISSFFFGLCWLPCLAAFYPGGVSIDSLSVLLYATGQAPITNHHPVLYTLLTEAFLNISHLLGHGTNFGIALFLFVQIAACAAAAGYMIGWLCKKGCSLRVLVPILCYFALNPIIAMYASTMWKDILFSFVLLVYILNLTDILISRGQRLCRPSFFIWFLFINLLICFLRNNGYYIVLATLPIVLILYRKIWKHLLPAFLVLLVLVPVIQGPVYTACGIRKSNFAESVGIPLQQIGGTIAEGGTITEQQKAFLSQILPLEEIKKSYSPFTADRLKFNKQFNNHFLEEHKAEFMKTWAEILPTHRKAYARAYLKETLGYWHVGTTNWAVCFGTVQGFGEKRTGIIHVKLPFFAANQTAMKTFTEQFQTATPVLSLLANIGFLFWTVIFAVFSSLARKRRKALVVFLPLLILWLTLMAAAPTFCEFRYMYAFSLIFPLAIVFSFPTIKIAPDTKEKPLPNKQ
jgi:hypothetical protein